jgi:hypothetical protein
MTAKLAGPAVLTWSGVTAPFDQWWQRHPEYVRTTA